MHKVANFIRLRFRFADPANRNALGRWETPERVVNGKQTNLKQPAFHWRVHLDCYPVSVC